MRNLILIFFALLATPLAYGQSFEYSVPVAPALAPFASFKLGAARLDINGSSYTLQFDLPHELTGFKLVTVSMNGTEQAGVIKFSGPLAEAECTKEIEKISCQIKYLASKEYSSGLAFYLYFHDHYKQRMMVAESFSSDPIGILEILP